jgi:hypothetical protein
MIKNNEPLDGSAKTKEDHDVRMPLLTPRRTILTMNRSRQNDYLMLQASLIGMCEKSGYVVACYAEEMAILTLP